jgi:hypothetical protein
MNAVGAKDLWAMVAAHDLPPVPTPPTVHFHTIVNIEASFVVHVAAFVTKYYLKLWVDVDLVLSLQYIPARRAVYNCRGPLVRDLFAMLFKSFHPLRFLVIYTAPKAHGPWLHQPKVVRALSGKDRGELLRGGLFAVPVGQIIMYIGTPLTGPGAHGLLFLAPFYFFLKLEL